MSPSQLNDSRPAMQWMLFVDGENFAIRAAKVAGSILVPGPHYEPNVFVWMPNVHPKVNFVSIKGGPELEPRSTRAFYFTLGGHPKPAINRHLKTGN